MGATGGEEPCVAEIAAEGFDFGERVAARTKKSNWSEGNHS
jgi:hypothetical protein